jgi:hypothetical protein
MVLLPGCECCGGCLPTCRYKISITSPGSLSSPSVCEVSGDAVSITRTPRIYPPWFFTQFNQEREEPPDTLSISCPNLDAKVSGSFKGRISLTSRPTFATGFSLGSRVICDTAGRGGLDIYYNFGWTYTVWNGSGETWPGQMCQFANYNAIKRVLFSDMPSLTTSTPIMWSISQDASGTSLGPWDSTTPLSSYRSPTAQILYCTSFDFFPSDHGDYMPQVDFMLELRESCQTNPLP